LTASVGFVTDQVDSTNSKLLKKRVKSAQKRNILKHSEAENNKLVKKERSTASTNIFSNDERKFSATKESESTYIQKIHKKETEKQRKHSHHSHMPSVTSALN